MAVFALLSAGGSPGVTTSALALTLSWPSQVILAECDPSGGDVLAGLLGGHVPASTGLLPLALEAGAGAEVPADTLWRHLIELDEEHNRLLLAGVSDPRQSAGLASSLPWIAEALQAMPADVLADCGRLDTVAAVRPVLSVARLAVLVLRPTLRQVSRAMSRIDMLAELVGRDRVVALLVGEGSASSRELAKTLGITIAGQLPGDEKTAAVLSDGSGSRRRLEARPLIRAATTAGRGLRDAVGAAGPLPGYPEQTGYPDQPIFAQYGGQPSLSQPSFYPSGTGQPSSVHPGDGRSIFSQPSFGQPGTSQPGTRQPGTRQPGTSQPGIGQPGIGQPDTDQSGSGQSGSGQAGSGQSGTSQPGLNLPGVAETGTGQSGNELPGNELPGNELPGNELPGSGRPGTRPAGFGQSAGAQFDSTQFNGAQFNGAQLNGAQLNGAQFDGAQFDGAQFDGAQFDNGQFNNGQFNNGHPGGIHRGNSQNGSRP